MLSLPPSVRIFVALAPTDMRKQFGAPGKAWCFQRVKFPHRQGGSRPTGNRVLASWR